MVRECLKEGFLTKEDATNTLKLGTNWIEIKSSFIVLDFKVPAERIFDFLVENKIILEKMKKTDEEVDEGENIYE